MEILPVATLSQRERYTPYTQDVSPPSAPTRQLLDRKPISKYPNNEQGYDKFTFTERRSKESRLKQIFNIPLGQHGYRHRTSLYSIDTRALHSSPRHPYHHHPWSLHWNAIRQGHVHQTQASTFPDCKV